jgi:hypothetical protein
VGQGHFPQHVSSAVADDIGLAGAALGTLVVFLLTTRFPAMQSKGIHIPSIYLHWLACYQGQGFVVAGISTAFR